MFFRGKEVAVVGGGNTAIQDAEFLSDYCSKVYLIHRRDEFRGENSGVKRLKEKENVEFILSATVKELVGESMVEKLILNDKRREKILNFMCQVYLSQSARSLKTRRLQIR